MISRRSFLGAILASCAAPAIVRADSLMRVIPKDTGILFFESSYPFAEKSLMSYASIMDEALKVAHDKAMFIDGAINANYGKSVRISQKLDISLDRRRIVPRP